MLGKEFRSLAEAVTQTYGNSPWFFLRELAQNSRDAGAGNIQVQAERTASGHELLTFADDGRGMSMAHARRFLFRLYASDKISDKMSAGKYGIGFWTILGYQPTLIRLQSRDRKEAWAVTLDADLEARPAPCTLTRPGTTITLERPAVFASAREFAGAVERELRSYCRYLRRKDRQGSMLPVFFHGQNMTVPITLPGPLSHSFHCGAVEGAVGLGEKPLVRLYARGLPVWEGALLEHMSHLQAAPVVQSEVGRGLAPVFLLNGNQLDVTFSRNLVLENRAMDKVRKTAEKALRRLLAHALQSAFPRKWYQRGGDSIQALSGRFKRPGWKLLPLALLVVLPLELFILSRLFPARSGPAAYSFDLGADSIRYSGATVSRSKSAWRTNFTYDPPAPGLFAVFAAADYDLEDGFTRLADPPAAAAPLFQGCEPENKIRMRVHALRGGRIFLPLPTGHAIDPASVVLGDGKRRPALSVNVLGEWSAQLPAGPAIVSYQSCPRPRERELPRADRERLTRLPSGLAWPEPLQRSLAEARFRDEADKAVRARDLVRMMIRYDDSEATARSFLTDANGQQWLGRVLAIGKGDCDVINGVYVLCLRKMGIPARLVIGLLGSRGRIQPGLHAWCEYFADGWQVADASAGAAGSAAPGTPNPGPQGGDPTAVPPPRRRPGISGLQGLVVPALLIIALLLVVILLVRMKYGRRFTAKPAVAAPMPQELLLPIIQQALLQPEVWGRQNRLFNHPFLPTLTGKPMAIRQAFALQRRGRLLVMTGHNQLVAAMKKRGAPILDLRHSLFTPLLSFLSAAVNLDALYRLRPQPPSRCGHDADKLLEAVNHFLRRKLKKQAPCLLSPGLEETDFHYVSLPVAPRQRHFFFPRHFIAVNPQAKCLLECAALVQKNRPLAVFRFLQALDRRSLLSVADPEAFLKKAARRLLRQ